MKQNLIDKGRPELGYDHKADLPGLVSKVSLHHKHEMRKSHPEKRAIDTRIQALKEEIRRNLIRAGRSAFAGNLDNAMRRHDYASHQMTVLASLVAKAQELALAPAKVDNADHPKPARSKTIVTRKTYKTWSKK